MGTALFKREVYVLQGSSAFIPKCSNRRGGRESCSPAITVSSIPCIWKHRLISFTLMNSVNSTYNHCCPFVVVADAPMHCRLSAGLVEAPAVSQAAHCRHYWPGAATWSLAQNPSRQHHLSTFPSTQLCYLTLYHHSKLPVVFSLVYIERYPESKRAFLGEKFPCCPNSAELCNYDANRAGSCSMHLTARCGLLHLSLHNYLIIYPPNVLKTQLRWNG